MGTPLRPEPSGKIQDASTKLVIDNPSAPSMIAEPMKEPLRPRPGLSAMATKVPDAPLIATDGRQVMLAFNPSATGGGAEDHTPKGAMKSRDGEGTDQPGAGYIRLRVRVTDGEMRIVGAQRVEGPLLQPTTFTGEHAYEVTLDGLLVAREGIPDMGVSRSYPRPGSVEHHVAERPTTELNIRVPLDRVPAAALGRLRLSLFRFPDALPRTITGTISQQLGRQALVVARVEALSQGRIEPDALKELQRLAPKAFVSPR